MASWRSRFQKIATAIAISGALFLASPRARADEPEMPTHTASADTATRAAPADASPPSTPVAAPPLSSEIDEWAAFAGQIVKMVAALGLFAAAGFIVAKVVGKKLSPLAGGDDDIIRVIEQKRLDPKTTLYLVEVAGHATLVAISESGVKSLSSLTLDEARVREAIDRRDARLRGRGAQRPFARVLAETRSPQQEKPS